MRLWCLTGLSGRFFRVILRGCRRLRAKLVTNRRFDGDRWCSMPVSVWLRSKGEGEGGGASLGEAKYAGIAQAGGP